MENERLLGYEDALELTTKIRKVCPYNPFASPITGDSAFESAPDHPSTILCLEKVQKGTKPDICAVIDNSDCPENISLKKLARLRRKIISFSCK